MKGKSTLFAALPLVFALVAIPIAAQAQIADVSGLIVETPDPVGDTQVLQTAVLGFTDFDPSSLIVTDEQLATAGPMAVIQVLIDDPLLIIVDDDLVQCPNAHFTSIQAAVIAAAPGGKIRVCPGIYNETVTIDKPLFLQAPRQQGQATVCQASAVVDPTKDAVLRYPSGPPGIGFNVQANDVMVSGFTITPAATVASNGVGIYTSRLFSGYELSHNHLLFNTFGLYFNSQGAIESVVRQNCFRGNNLPGAASGNGIYSDQGLHNALIRDNYSTLHRNACIVLTAVPSVSAISDVRVTHNDCIDDSSMALFFTNNIIVNYNRVIRPRGTAIFVGGGIDTAEISFNHLEALPGVPAEDLSGNGISITTSVGPSQNVKIKSNKVLYFDGSGIRLGNGATLNTVETNRSEANEVDGIHATSTATNNIIKNNHMKLNVEHDCHDESVGPHNPPAMVANQWINDLGQTENKIGLCKLKP